MSRVLKLRVGKLPASSSPVASISQPRLLPCTTTPSGILTVTLHEGVGFSMPYDCECPFSLSYTLLEYEKSQVLVHLTSAWLTEAYPQWESAVCKFDVTRASSLVIHLYCERQEYSESSYHLLGLTTLRLFDGATELGSQWLQMQDGKSKIRISLEYMPVENRRCEVDTNPEAYLNYSRDVWLVEEKETKRKYASRSISPVGKFQLSNAATTIGHPFIAPLVSSLRFKKRVLLFSPLVHGGHLFNHLQKVRRFDVDRSRFYIAEIVCALEYLHNTCDIKAGLKPANVLLDALGHITLCGFGIFIVQNKRKRQEYPAPESLIDEASDSKAEDWWTLGIFLYEILTGAPPFCDDNPEAIRRNILEQTIHFPTSIDPLAVDLLTKLLDRSPENRLGVGGVAEVKAHAFFRNINWHNLLDKKCKPPYRPDYFAGSLQHYGVDYPMKPHRTLQEQFCGWEFKRPVSAQLESEAGTGHHQRPNPPFNAVEKTDIWELLWMEETGDVYFHNRTTKTKQLIHVGRVDTSSPIHEEPVAESTISHVPSPAQKKKALEAAIEAGHVHIISQLLNYGMNMTMPIFVNEQRTTLLEWAVDQNNAKLLNRLLADKPDRVAATRALGMAVDKQHTIAAKFLLAHGVQCNFQESGIREERPRFSSKKLYQELDRPPRLDLLGNRSYQDLSDPEIFNSPLVRAVQHGNIELARLLLKHGADANAGYHDLSLPLPDLYSQEPIAFKCGRPVQLAMELGYLEIVQLLLDAGADIDLAQPVWNVSEHECEFVPRAIYLRVAVGLRRLWGQAKAQHLSPLDPAISSRRSHCSVEEGKPKHARRLQLRQKSTKSGSAAAVKFPSGKMRTDAQ